jgi:hypothetical protein
MYYSENNLGANRAIVNYNASVVETYNSTSILVRFEIQNVFFQFEKRSGVLQRQL